MARFLVSNGCTSREGKGNHIKWYSPYGEHMAVITEARIVSPGVVRDTIAKLVCRAAAVRALRACPSPVSS